MIQYNSGSFGFSILLRVHGSAAYKSLLPAITSTFIYVVLFETVDVRNPPLFLHPYPMGALISALTFLLAFRANFSYNRYWESIAAVHQMHSKWLDVGMTLAAFHLQATVYNNRKPPSFGAHPELNELEIARERNFELTLAELEVQLEVMQHETHVQEVMGDSAFTHSSLFRRRRQRPEGAPEMNVKVYQKPASESQPKKHRRMNQAAFSVTTSKQKSAERATVAKSINAVSLSTNRKKHKRHSTTEKRIILENAVVQAAAHIRSKAWDPDKPPLFLQEAAHLLSLLSAVAFSTLRNDLEQADSPLIPFTPNAPWPHVDPDAYGADTRKDWKTNHYAVTVIRYLCGFSRTPAARTLYNAARPFRVIGGVSDAEIELLQAARGPLAKVALCTLWLQEFIMRESLAGATGNVAPPILSRLFQYTSDGMIGYNQARKVAYIPFPFPHAQITSLFVLIVVGLMPVLMLAYVTNEAFGFFLNLVCVMSFTGLHEVARELENPFQNVPNDVPLNNFQAQFNESLMQMFTGYHPDAHWEVVEKKKEPADVPSAPSTFRGETISDDDEAEVPGIERTRKDEMQDMEGDVELGKLGKS